MTTKERNTTIQKSFKNVQSTIQKYGNLSDDVYTFDENNFAMGLCATQKVITRSEFYVED
ncbi:hypothetical protein N7528_007464 [Penicillium herquei]|nr:hypothetical protein N7528_007464 [Penicillium herquei]